MLKTRNDKLTVGQVVERYSRKFTPGVRRSIHEMNDRNLPTMEEACRGFRDRPCVLALCVVTLYTDKGKTIAEFVGKPFKVLPGATSIQRDGVFWVLHTRQHVPGIGTTLLFERTNEPERWPEYRAGVA